jgi:hypothetical protein
MAFQETSQEPYIIITLLELLGIHMASGFASIKEYIGPFFHVFIHHIMLGMCAGAAMYLKGEGGEQNTSRAVEIYEKAASLGSNKALNGLGYIYFFGQTVPKNEV